MKTYRLELNIGGIVFVDAERHQTQDGKIAFYRGDTVFAEYAEASIKHITSPIVSFHKIGIFAPASQPDHSD